MTRLAILRHAKSSWDDAGLGDFDRPLNERGIKAARRIGRELKDRGMRFDHVLASPALRVRETLAEVAKGYGSALEIEFDERIYMASLGVLLGIVREIPDGANAPLLVGHNPGLHQLVLNLTGDDRVREKFPTAALAVIESATRSWKEIERGALVELILPRELDD